MTASRLRHWETTGISGRLRLWQTWCHWWIQTGSTGSVGIAGISTGECVWTTASGNWITRAWWPTPCLGRLALLHWRTNLAAWLKRHHSSPYTTCRGFLGMGRLSLPIFLCPPYRVMSSSCPGLGIGSGTGSVGGLSPPGRPSSGNPMGGLVSGGAGIGTGSGLGSGPGFGTGLGSCLGGGHGFPSAVL